MPDENGDPTDVEMANQLGWDPSDGEGSALLDTGDDGGTGDQPQANTATADIPQAVTPQEQQPAPPMDMNVPQQPPQDPLRQQLEYQNRQLREQQIQGQIQQNGQQYMTSLVNQGWDEQQAGVAAQQYMNSEWQGYQAQQSQQLAEVQAKRTRAFEVSQSYGTPVDQLMQYNDPYGMEQAAKMYRETQGRIRDLESRFNTSNQAPIQSYDSNNMATSNSPTAKKLRYATDPNYNLTAEEFKSLFG